MTAASRGQRGFLLTTPIHISSFGVDNGIGFHGALMIVRDGDDRIRSVEVLGYAVWILQSKLRVR